MSSEVVRAAIQELLADFSERPLFNLREAGPLMRGAKHEVGGLVETSRAHLEMKVGGHLRADVVVLNADGPVQRSAIRRVLSTSLLRLGREMCAANRTQGCTEQYAVE